MFTRSLACTVDGLACWSNMMRDSRSSTGRSGRSRTLSRTGLHGRCAQNRVVDCRERLQCDGSELETRTRESVSVQSQWAKRGPKKFGMTFSEVQASAGSWARMGTMVCRIFQSRACDFQLVKVILGSLPQPLPLDGRWSTLFPGSPLGSLGRCTSRTVKL